MRKINSLLCFILILSLFCTKGAASQTQGQRIIDSLHPLLIRAKEDSNKVKLFEGLAAAFYAINPDSGIYYANKQLTLAKSLKWETGIGWAYNNLGVNYWAKSDYNMALEYYVEALKKGEATNQNRLVTSALGNISSIHYANGDYKKSLEMDLAVIKKFEEMGDKAAVARNLGNVAGTYVEIGDRAKAIEFYNKAFQINKELGRKLSMALNLQGLGSIYQGQGDYSKALEHHFEALKLNKEVNSKTGIAQCFRSIGLCYLKIAKSGNKNLLHQFSFPDKQALLNHSTAYIDSSLEVYNTLGSITGMMNNYSTISEIRELEGDYKGSLAAYKTFKSLTDSVFNKEKEKKITEKLMQYEFDKKQDLARAEQERKDANARRTKNFQFIAIVFFLLIAAFLYWINRQQQKGKLKIEKAYAELKATQAQLIQSEKMASLGELTAGIAHEIQNPLNFVNNFAEVNAELNAEVRDLISRGDLGDAEELLATVSDNDQKILHHGKRADAIVKGMLQHSQKGSGIKEPTNINALADEYLRLAYHGLRAKDKSFNATIKTDFDQNIGNIMIIPQDIGRVLLNLINNAFYAVDEKKKQIGDGYEPEVTVTTKRLPAPENPSIRQSANSIMISVRDNGNGIPDDIRNKIFQPFFTTKPTGQGTGLGLSLSYDIIKAHGGEIRIDTEQGSYTQFMVLLPLN